MGKKIVAELKKNLLWEKKIFVGKKNICFGKKKAKKRMHYAWRTARQGRLRRPPTPAGVSGKARHRLMHGAPTHRRLGVPSSYAEAYIYIYIATHIYICIVYIHIYALCVKKAHLFCLETHFLDSPFFSLEKIVTYFESVHNQNTICCIFNKSPHSNIVNFF